MSITRTSLTHPTMIKKVRAAMYYANKGMGHKMNGHNKRCYIQNAKGRNIMRLDWIGGAQGYIVWGDESRDITNIVKGALASVTVRELSRKKSKIRSFALAYNGRLPKGTIKPIIAATAISTLGLLLSGCSLVQGLLS